MSFNAHVATENAPALVAHDVSVVLQEKSILRGVSLEAYFGQVTAILGPNGAGKTTFVKTLVGLLPYQGSITHQGIELRDTSAEARAQNIAYVPQRSQLNVNLIVRDVVAMARYARAPHAFSLCAEDHIAIDEALRRASAETLAEASYCQLSGGEQQRVLLARALASGAKTILLDEPSLSLDIQHTLRLFAQLRELSAASYSIIAVLHDIDDVRRFTDSAILLNNGRLACSGASAQVTSPAQIRAVYQISLIENERLGYSCD